MTPAFQFWRSPSDGMWRFRLRAPNGKVILQSEGYKRRRDCLRGIASVQKFAPCAEVRAAVAV